MEMVQEIIRKGVVEKMTEIDSKRTSTYSRPLCINDGPLASEIYDAVMVDFKPESLLNFLGSRDSQDPQHFVYGLLERLRLQGATDAIMCRVFTTCLMGEAWKWYMWFPPRFNKKH